MKTISPFSFPTETDGRFILLIILTFVNLFSVLNYFISAYIIVSDGNNVGGLVALIISLFVLYTAYLRAKTFALRTKLRNGWTDLPLSGDSLREQNIAKIHNYAIDLADITQSETTFWWDNNLDSNSSRLPSGRAVGFNNRNSIVLRDGLHDAYVAKKDDTLRSVILHELAHIKNKDLGRTVMAIELTRLHYIVTFLTLLALNIRSLFASTSSPTIIVLNMIFIFLTILIELIFRSILRVREYYADVRASEWLGNTKPLIEMLSEKEEKESSKISKIIGYFALRHPTSQRRLEVLDNPNILFHTSHEIAFVGGMLGALALDGLTLTSAIIGWWISEVASGMNSPQLIDFFGKSGATIISNLSIGVIVTVFLAIALILILGSILPFTQVIGMQIQKNSFLFKQLQIFASKEQHRFNKFKYAVWVTLGAFLGMIISPFGSPLSLGLPLIIEGTRVTLLLMFFPIIFCLWLLVFLPWIFILFRISGWAYTSYKGSNTPTFRRRILIFFSTVALMCVLVPVIFIQQSIMNVAYGNAISINDTLAVSIIFLIAGNVLSCFAWGALFLVITVLNIISPKNEARNWMLSDSPVKMPELTSVSIPVQPPLIAPPLSDKY